jgi:ATP-dependent Clp protease ATP-binding subunit ClpA
MQVAIVQKRLADKNIKLEFSTQALTYLAKEGYNPRYGARPLKRLIQNKVLTPIATMMVSEGMMGGGVVKVDVKNDEFVFDSKKKAKARKRVGVKRTRKAVAAK